MKKLFTLLCLILTTIVSAQISTTGLVAYYPFTGTANDFSGNSNNGTNHAAVLTTDRFGTANSAYSFNGVNQWISVNNSANLNPTTQLSISFWIKTTASHSNAGIVGKWNNFGGSTGTGQEQYVLNASAQGVGFFTMTSANNSATEPTAIYNNGNWNHYVGTWTGSQMKLYRNGVLVQTTAQTGTISSFTQGLEIGRYAGGQSPSNYFNGTLDDIRIYNVALTSTQITALYNESMCTQLITVTDTLIINANLTGYNPISYANTIKIFPNPSNDHITIDYGSFASLNGYTLKILNSLGQVVFTTPITQQQSFINLSTWTGTGVYFAHLIDSQSNTIDVRKIVIQ